jgi:phosphate transport system protein
MTRATFEQNLQQVKTATLSLGATVEQVIGESMASLEAQDSERAWAVIRGDRAINEKRFAIEHDALALIATQQPMAGDLRVLAAVLEIVTELERMADYAKGIAKITLLIGQQPFIKPLIDLPRMAEMARSMLRRSLEAFARQDVDAARAIAEEDGKVDALYNQVYRELLTFIMCDPANMEQASHMLWVAHNLERAADRVTNICERVIFTETGEMLELDGEGREDLGVEGFAQ